MRRHLAAFGPATATDVQTWSGLGGLADAVKQLGDELIAFKHGRKTLYDLPDAPRPGAETPAPPRLLPEFDSLLLAYRDRTRIVADEYRKGLVTKNLRIKATFLVDGFVAGSWSVERTTTTATLTLAPFAKLAKQDRDALEDEAEALLEFSEPESGKRAVAFG